jgi:hypothetical protein
MSRRAATTICALVIGLLVPLLVPGPAQAAVENASIVKSHCDRFEAWQNWRGGFIGPKPDKYTKTFGKFGLCLVKYKIDDKERRYNYYALEAMVYYRAKNVSTLGGSGSLSVRSDMEAKDGFFFASPSQRGESCSEPVTISLSYGFVSGSVTPRICDEKVVKRKAQTTRGGRWATANVAKTGKWDVVYIQKVRRGSVPKFKVRMVWPFYAYHAPDATHSTWWYTKNYGATTTTF